MGGYIWHLIWEHHVKILLGDNWAAHLGMPPENWNSMFGSGGISGSSSGNVTWKLELNEGYIWQLFCKCHLHMWTKIWGVYLGTLSENLTLFWVLLLLHRGLFYERPIIHVKQQNKERHRFSLGQVTENPSVNPLVALWYVLTLIPMGQRPWTTDFFPIDVMLNSTIRRITSYRRNLLVNDPENLWNLS